MRSIIRPTLLGTLAIAAGSAAPMDTPPLPGSDEIVVRTLDYAFELPATVRPGRRTVRLVNEGREAHHVWFFRLPDDKRLSDFLGALSPHGFPEWAKSVGGPNAPVPGGETVGIVDLAPGRYVAICVIPSPDGAPHFMKGMAKELMVAGPPVPAPRSRPDVVARLTDYDFVLSRPLGAGRQVIQFTNDAGQIHEAFVARLQPGKTAADLMAWEKNPATPFPAVPMGGITGIEPGAVQSIVVDLEPGRYVLICFVPDAGDGRPHHAHGMVKEIDVPASGGLASTPR